LLFKPERYLANLAIDANFLKEAEKLSKTLDKMLASKMYYQSAKIISLVD